MTNQVAHQDTLTTDTPTVSPTRGRWPKIWPHALALGLYTLLTFFYMQPLLARFFEDVPFGGDSWIFYWDLWWVKKSVVDLQTNPFYTTYVNFPQGASLHFHTLAFLNGLLSIPLQLAGLSLAGTYNVFVLFGYIFSAYGTFLLADYLVHDKRAAFVGGLVFGFSPFHFAHLIGQLNFVSIQWMPFYVLFMLKAAEANRPLRSKTTWANISLAALFLALNALTEWTLAAFLVMLTGLYGLYWLGQKRREWKASLGGPVLRLALVGGLFVILTAPVLFPMLSEARSNQNIRYDPQESVLYSADLLSFVTPYELHPVLGKWSSGLAQKFTGNPAERTAFLGWLPLLLAMLGWWFYRKRADSGANFWGLSALAFAVLSLGPTLHIAGRTVFTVFKLSVPLPYAALYYLPFFSIMRTPARFALVVMLALAVLSAFGCKALTERLKTRLTFKKPGASRLVPVGLALVASLLIVFEFAPFVTTAYPKLHPIYEPIRRDPDRSQAVLELPLRPISHYYISQPAYDKPMVGGYLARQVENPLIEQNPALKALALRPVSTGADVKQLREANIRYVMVNWWLLSPEERPKMQAVLQQIFARPPDSEELEPDGQTVRFSLYIIPANG